MLGSPFRVGRIYYLAIDVREVEYGRVTESELASEVRRIARRETYILQKLESTEKQVNFLSNYRKRCAGELTRAQARGSR